MTTDKVWFVDAWINMDQIVYIRTRQFYDEMVIKVTMADGAVLEGMFAWPETAKQMLKTLGVTL